MLVYSDHATDPVLEPQIYLLQETHKTTQQHSRQSDAPQMSQTQTDRQPNARWIRHILHAGSAKHPRMLEIIIQTIVSSILL